MRIDEVLEPSIALNDVEQRIVDLATRYSAKIVGGRYQYQLHIPRKLVNTLTEDIKPTAQLWTSTADRRGRNYWTSEWHHYLQVDPEFAEQWTMDTAVLYRVKSDAKILPMGSDSAARQIAAILGQRFGREDFSIYTNYPWNILRNLVDGVRYAPRGQHHHRQGWRNHFMRDWSVESTAWFRTDCLERVGVVNLSQTRFA